MKALLVLVLSFCLVAQAQTSDEQEVQKLRDTAYVSSTAWSLTWRQIDLTDWSYILYSGHYLVVMVNKLNDRSPVTMGLVREHNRIYSAKKTGGALTDSEIDKLYWDSWNQFDAKRKEQDAKRANLQLLITDANNMIASLEASKTALQSLNANSDSVIQDRKRIVDSMLTQIQESDSRRSDLEKKLAAGNLAITAARFDTARQAAESSQQLETGATADLENLRKGRSEYITSARAMAPSLPEAVIRRMSKGAIEELDSIIEEATDAVGEIQEDTADFKAALARLEKREADAKKRVEDQIAAARRSSNNLQTSVEAQKAQGALSEANRRAAVAGASEQIALIETEIQNLRTSVEIAAVSRNRLITLVASLK